MENERRDDVVEGIELPAPTNAPLYFALGLALLLAGLVTNEIVSAVGVAIAVLGAIGWWREVLPHEHEAAVPLQPEALRARPVEARLAAGEEPLAVRRSLAADSSLTREQLHAGIAAVQALEENRK